MHECLPIQDDKSVKTVLLGLFPYTWTVWSIDPDTSFSSPVQGRNWTPKMLARCAVSMAKGRRWNSGTLQIMSCERARVELRRVAWRMAVGLPHLPVVGARGQTGAVLVPREPIDAS